MAAISKFEQHTYAGLHLEKLHTSRDDRVRTIRIDKLLELAEPALKALARTADQLLFAYVSDSDLKRLGIDAQVLPIVRLLTSETHLELLQTMLPEAQYAALYALACGMTVEEAWTEVVQYLPDEVPRRGVDPDDLVAAMERTPAQVAFVSGDDELRSILAHPFAAWRIFLHPAQRRMALETTYSGPAQVTGGAGTGKTITALHRAAYLAGRPAASSADQQPSILLTSFTRNLVDALGAQLPLIVSDDQVRARIDILNVDQLARRIVSQARGRHPAAANDHELRQKWAAAAAEARLPFAPVFLHREWEQVILAQDLPTEQAYLTCLRDCSAQPSRPGPTTCSSPAIRISASTRTASRWPASGSASAAAAAA
jgi:hypothetical protein